MFPKTAEMKTQIFYLKNYIENKGGRDLEEEEEKREQKKDLKTIAMNNESVLLMACPKCSIFM